MRLNEQRTTVGVVVQLLLFSICFLQAPGVLAAENVISKGDVERIFAMRMADWEAYAPRVAHPGWKVQVRPIATGSAVTALNPSMGTGLSIQPLYANDNGPPTLLVVGTFYRMGTMPNLAAAQNDIERDAQRDLGPRFHVTSRHVRMSPPWEGIELTVTLASDGTK